MTLVTLMTVIYGDLLDGGGYVFYRRWNFATSPSGLLAFEEVSRIREASSGLPSATSGPRGGYV
jgi:hypothetical protein